LISQPLPALVSRGQILAEVAGPLGVITLHRPETLNALSLEMIRDLTTLLRHWTQDDGVQAVVVRGARHEGRRPVFSAGGDIRALHGWALAGDARIEDFFSEEYSLNHLINTYGKPYIALMDGITMGGGMGISQGGALRIVTEHSRLAMPETHIGLFPDVGGGHFLSRLPGSVGEYLALTGHVLKAGDALALGLADQFLHSEALPDLVERLAGGAGGDLLDLARTLAHPGPAGTLLDHRPVIDHHFSAPTLGAILASLEQDPAPFAQQTLATLHQRSPLMMAVTLELIRRGRHLPLVEDLRLERDLVRHCFQFRRGAASETVEGIRALVVDKDKQPRWNPARVADVTPDMVAAFFESPWTEHGHPLRHLA